MPNTAVAFVGVLPVTCEPDIVIVGALVYPLPGLVTTILVTFPYPKYALATAPVPPPPENSTVGSYVKPEPASPILT